MPAKNYNFILDEHLHILITQGNHEAFIELKRRYSIHANALCKKLLSQYPNTGVSLKELVAVCDDTFPIVLRKYLSGVSSFYLFWEKLATQAAMDHLVDFSYGAEGVFFSTIFSIDSDIEGKYGSLEFLKEKDQNREAKRQVFEVKSILEKYKKFFTETEKSLLNLVLSGLSISDIESTGIYSRSQLYLTFSNAIAKVKRYLKH